MTPGPAPVPPVFDLAALAPRPVDLAGLRPFWPTSFGRPPDGLAADLAAHGLRRPLLVLDDGRSLAVLAGSRRREALLSLGRAEAPAVALPREMPGVLALGLADNAERGWNPAETALVWRFLADRYPDQAPGLAPLLGLDSPKMRDLHLAAASLPAEGLAALADDRLDLENAARLARWDPADQDAALDLFEALRPSKQKKRQWLDWLEDLVRRDRTRPLRVLSSPEIKAARAEIGRAGRPAAEEAARQHLWARRHPGLADLMRTRQARLKALRLPPEARLELDPTLEDVRFGLRLTFSTPDEFAALIDRAATLARDPDFRALLDDTPAPDPDDEAPSGGLSPDGEP